MAIQTRIGHESRDFFRASSFAQPANPDLGILHSLPGRWIGKGFNLIARPARQGNEANPVFFLELNATQETLEFTAIGGDVPNRGDIEPTALLHAVHYLQTVADCADNSFIHKEPGLWLHVPATEDGEESYVRLATVPHGDSLLAQSLSFATRAGGPDIQPVIALPFPMTEPIPALNDTAHPTLSNPVYLAPYLNDPLPAECLPDGLTAADTIRDPSTVLRAQIAAQSIIGTDVITISTAATNGGGIVNIPFVVRNANAVQMDAIFWIERVSRPAFDTRPRDFLQLQYVQRVILDFEEIHWPHVSVATLVKAA